MPNLINIKEINTNGYMNVMLMHTRYAIGTKKEKVRARPQKTGLYIGLWKKRL